MAAFVISFTNVIVFLTVAASGIVSLYSAVNALAVATDMTVFLSGIVVIALAALAGPLFAFTAAYGFVYHLGFPVGKAIVVTAPYMLAWCVAAVRTVAGYLRNL